MYFKKLFGFAWRDMTGIFMYLSVVFFLFLSFLFNGFMYFIF